MLFRSNHKTDSKKELIIEPINEYIGPNVSKVMIDQKKYFTSKKSSKPLVFLNTILNSRNPVASQTRIGNSQDNKMNYDFSNNNEDDKRQLNHEFQDRFESIKIIKNFYSKEPINNIEKLPGNCIVLISEYMDKKLSFIVGNKKIFVNFSKCKIKAIDNCISHCNAVTSEITEVFYLIYRKINLPYRKEHVKNLIK